MSDDSDNDMGGLGPKTSVKQKPAAKNTRERRPVAGSSKPISKTSTRSKVAPETVPSDSSGVEEVTREEMDKPPAKRPKRTAAAATNGVNGQTTTKGKGKGKAAPSKSNKKAPQMEVIDDETEDPDAVAEGLMKAINDSHATNTRPLKSDQEIARLKRKLVDAEARSSAFEKQLEEIMRVRHTEPEEILKRMVEQYEQRLSDKDQHIKELSSALAMKEPLMNSGKTSALHLLTREAADSEKRHLQKELEKLAETAKLKDDALRGKEQDVKDLQAELKAEREVAKSMATRPTGSTTQNRIARGPLGSDDPKHAEVIKFYEDLSNILVTSMKRQTPQYLNLDEWLVTCIYTYTRKRPRPDIAPTSITFNLRFHYTIAPGEADPITDPNQLVPAMRFSPLDLDKETPEFQERLGYLTTSFVFERSQLPLFLRSIHAKMSEALDDEDDEEEEGDEDEEEEDVVMIDD